MVYTVPVDLVPRPHLGIAEMLGVGTGADVGRVGLLPDESVLSSLSPHLPDEIDETVVEEEDRVVGRGTGRLHVASDPEVDGRVRVFDGTEVGPEGTARLGRSVGQHILDLRLREETVDVRLGEQLPLGGQPSKLGQYSIIRVTPT